MGIDWEKIDEIVKASHVPPEDAFTIDDYAARYDVSYNTARRRLNKLAGQGVIEKHWSNGNKAYFTLSE